MGIVNPYFINLSPYYESMNNFIEENDSPYRKEIGYPFSLSRECHSNPEFVKFKCPACGHGLGEEEYHVSCEEIRTLGNKIAKRIVQEHIGNLDNEYLEDIQRGKGT